MSTELRRLRGPSPPGCGHVRPDLIPDRDELAYFVDRYRGTADEAAAVLAEPFDGVPLTPEELARRATRRFPFTPGPRRAVLVARALELLATWAPGASEPLPTAARPGRPSTTAAATPSRRSRP